MHTTLYANLHCLDITIITSGLCQFSLPVSVMYRILLLFPVCICSVHFEDQDHLSVRFQIHLFSLLSQICTTDQDVLQKASIKGGGGGERERERGRERERERERERRFGNTLQIVLLVNLHTRQSSITSMVSFSLYRVPVVTCKWRSLQKMYYVIKV